MERLTNYSQKNIFIQKQIIPNQKWRNDIVQNSQGYYFYFLSYTSSIYLLVFD
jgi:hypothetical protein